MNTNIETLIAFIASQMDGAAVPATGSAELNRLERAVAELLKHQSGAELQILGTHTISAVIDRVSSNISAEKTLRQFLQGGDRA
ncbi:MAG: hypothetical protein Q7T78_04405 [Rhodoferax sp.]|nr:hypothetical protein [Rhodoferax sp.]